jgi:glyceraldehyde 3-phosphate dehydrogenase
MNMKTSTGINGFGRFGMHLLKYWIERHSEATFSIDFINSTSISSNKLLEIIRNDPHLAQLNQYILLKNNTLIVSLPSGKTHNIEYSQKAQNQIPWLGKPVVYLECSGKNTDADQARTFLVGNTKYVLISASSPKSDKTLIYGYNHQNFTDIDKIFSYGSCTVNAYVPLANFINSKFGIIDSDVNVIHNVPVHKYEESNTLDRRTCTLQWSAPKLLPFISKDNFKVNYTLVPYLGISLIDFRFRIKSSSKTEIMKSLNQAIDDGALKGLYKFEKVDTGPEPHKFTPYSAVLIERTLDLIGNNLYIQAYFDNENSVNRYFDVLSFLSQNI